MSNGIRNTQEDQDKLLLVVGLLLMLVSIGEIATLVQFGVTYPVARLVIVLCVISVLVGFIGLCGGLNGSKK